MAAVEAAQEGAGCRRCAAERATEDGERERSSFFAQQGEEIENKIETADALAVKLLQRFNYSLTSMRSTSHNLIEGNNAMLT